jgi:hypothetical protein
MVNTNLNSFLSDIEEIKIPESLDKLSYNDFMHLSVELSKETGQLIGAAASIVPKGGVWERDAAIIVGHFVRLFKLISAQIDQTCKGRQEIAWIFSRPIFETIVNAKYLFKNPDAFDNYVIYSLQNDKELKDDIDKKITEREGEVLPIETRMLQSIENCMGKSGVDWKSIPDKRLQSWGERNIYARTKAVGLEEMYLAFMGGSSQAVHGNWLDLLVYHLVPEDDGFKPNMSWTSPSPQLLISTSFLGSQLINEFLEYIGIEKTHLLYKRSKSLYERTIKVNDAYELYIQKKGTK